MIADKHKRFCEEYMIDLNGKQAAIRTGYSEDRAEVTASELLTREDVKVYLIELKRQASDKLEIKRERVLKEFACIAFADIRKYYDQDGNLLSPSDLDDDAAAALAGIEVFEEFEMTKGTKKKTGNTKKIKIWNKLQALDSLAKHLGLFEEDNKQKTQDLDLNNLTTEEKYQYFVLRQKAKSLPSNGQ
jgi:phage terminase small subunit